MDIVRIARRVNDKSKKSKKKRGEAEIEVPEIVANILDPGIEYSFKVDLSFSVDFEGDADASPATIQKKLKSESVKAIKSAMSIIASDFGLKATGIKMSPVVISAAVNDQTSSDEKSRW